MHPIILPEDRLTPLIDIGVNLGAPAFDHDRDAVVVRALQAGITGMLLTGTSVEESEKVLALAKHWSHLMRATAGVHPHHASEWNESVAASIRTLLSQPEVVAVGETGLDFNRNFSTPAEQEHAFEAQLALAAETGKPLFIHEREAGTRLAEMIKPWRDRLSGAVVHCFTGDEASLKAYLDLDLYIGVTGWICDERRGQHLWSLVKAIPAERLLVETDAPWLLPRTLRPKPKKGRNEPAFLPWVLRQLAECRKAPEFELAQQTSDNACRLFQLPPTFALRDSKEAL